MGNQGKKKMRDLESATVAYEGGRYQVWVGMEVEEVEEVLVLDREMDISPVMDQGVMDWMLEKAIEDIYQAANDPVFLDMNSKEREIDEAGLVYEGD